MYAVRSVADIGSSTGAGVMLGAVAGASVTLAVVVVSGVVVVLVVVVVLDAGAGAGFEPFAAVRADEGVSVDATKPSEGVTSFGVTAVVVAAMLVVVVVVEGGGVHLSPMQRAGVTLWRPCRQMP